MATAFKLGVMSLLLIGWLGAEVACGHDVSPTKVRWRHQSSARGELPVPGVGNQQTACVVADFDGDGRQEFAIAERTASPAIVGYEWEADGWERWIIEPASLPIEAGGAVCDINGDGRLDLVLGGDYRSNELWWWENPGKPFKGPWPRHVIKSQGANQHHDQLAADFDGDGRPEIVFFNQRARTLFLAPIPQQPTAQERWQLKEVWSWSGPPYEGLARADINGDGKEDIVGGGYWFKNEGGDRFVPHLIDEYRSSRCAVGDLIEGDSPEVVLNSGDGVGPLALYEFRNDRWHQTILVPHVDHGHTLELGDINGDGHLDIYAAEMHTPGAGDRCRQWVFYGNGKGRFRAEVISLGICNHESRLSDLNGDGRPDIVGKPYTWKAPGINVWLNEGPEG